jgi:PAS domain S-box-containing protein
VVETQAELICRFRADGTLTFVNDAYCRWFGLAREEVIGRRFLDLLSGPERAAERRRLAALVADPRPATSEHEAVRPDGSVGWQRWETRPLRDARGAVVEFQAAGHDVTERKRAEEALRASQSRYELATAAGGAGVWDWDLATDEIFVDPALKAILGFADHEIRNHLDDWGRRVHPADAGRVMDAATAHLAGRTPTYEVEHRMLARDGGVRWFLARGVTVRDADGRATRLVGTDVDITASKRSEAALRRSRDEVRRLAGQLIAAEEAERRRIGADLHDGPAQGLFALTLTLARLEQAAPELDASGRALLGEAGALAEQALREVRTLTHLLRPPLLDGAGLPAALRAYAAGFAERSGVAVEVAGPAALGGLPPEAEAALFRVAQEALTNVQRHSGSACARIALTAGAGRVVLRVEDRGRGLPAAAPGGGAPTGVGIASMRERLRRLGGRLTVRSGARGTTVTAHVPVAAADGDARPG